MPTQSHSTLSPPPAEVIQVVSSKPLEPVEFWSRSADLLCVVDEDGRILGANAAWEEQLGHPRGELLATRFADLLHADDHPSLLHAVVRVRRSDGSYRRILWTRYPHGDRCYLAGQDVTCEELAGAVLDALQDGVVLIDADLRVVGVNRPLCEMTGYAEHEWLGATAPYPAWPTDAAEQLQRHLEAATAAGRARYDVMLERRVGEPFRALLDVSPVKLAGGRPGIVCVVRDATEQARERLELAAAEFEAERARDFLQSTLDSLSAQIAVLDQAGDVVGTNRAWDGAACEAGITAAVGGSYLAGWDAAAPADDRSAAIAAGVRAVLRGERDCFEFEYDSAGARWYLVRVTRHRGGRGTRVVVQRDEVTAQRRAQEASMLQARLLDEVDAAVVATRLDGIVTYWNDGAERLYGWSRHDTVGRHVSEFIAPGDDAVAARVAEVARSLAPWEGEYAVRHKDGRLVPSDHRLATVEDPHGAPIGLIGVSVDVSERVRAAAELRSARDHLRAVTDSMGEGLYSIDDAGRLTYMNAAAEKLLGWTADELAGENMHDRIHNHRPVDACPVFSARTADSHIQVEDDVFLRKDGTQVPVSYTVAPFEADAGIRGAVVVFRDPSKDRARRAELEREVEALAWIARIRDALEADRFVLHAQPIIDLASGETVQHELLIRMTDEEGQLVPPGLFLPVAEEYGLIREIDRWVIRQAAALAADGHPVEVNLSAESLGDATLLGFVEQELGRAGADPKLIVFELTETGLLRDEQSAQSFIEGVAALGSHVALDDFGTGYGGFTYVKRLPVDYLKIDVEFVRDLAQNSASQHVVRAVVNLARDFGHCTVAEGVEDNETLELLRALGVDLAQGYGIGRPAPLDQVLGAR